MARLRINVVAASLVTLCAVMVTAGSAHADVLIYRVSESAVNITNHQPSGGRQSVTRKRFSFRGYAVIDVETLEVRLIYTEKTKTSRLYSRYFDQFVDSGAEVGKSKLLRKHVRTHSSGINTAGSSSITRHFTESISGIHNPTKNPFPSCLESLLNVSIAGSRVTLSAAVKGTWALDRKRTNFANAVDPDRVHPEGTLARGEEEITDLLESKGYMYGFEAVLTPKRTLLGSGLQSAVLIEETFH